MSMSKMPEGAESIDPPIQVEFASWVPMKVDAKVWRHGVMWYRVQGGFGGRGDREDWIADLPISICVHDYHWNGEIFGPNYGSFDNACLQEMKHGLKFAEDKLVKLEEEKIRINEGVDRIRWCLSGGKAL